MLANEKPDPVNDHVGLLNVLYATEAGLRELQNCDNPTRRAEIQAELSKLSQILNGIDERAVSQIRLLVSV